MGSGVEVTKYDLIEQIPISTADLQDYVKVVGRLDKGIVLSASPQDLELDQSPDLEGVRVEKGGLRQDFSLTELSTAAALAVLSLGEHRYVLSDNSIFERIFRVFRQANTFFRVESWNDVVWGIEYDAENTVVDAVLLSFRSFFGSAYWADGSRAIEWKQSTSLSAQSDEFAAGVTLTVVGNTVDAVITPAAAYLGKYNIHYKLTLTGPSAAGSSVVVSILDDAAVEIVAISHPIPADTNTNRVHTLSHEIAAIVDTIASGEKLTLKLKAITAVVVTRTNTLAVVGPVPQLEVTKTPAREAQNDSYTFKFNLDATGSDAGTFIEFYFDTGAGFVLWDNGVEYFEGIDLTRTLVQAGLGSGDKFGIHVIAGDQGDYNITFAEVTWGDAFDEGVVVEGFNKATDGDPSEGVTYDTEGTPTNDLYELDKDPAVTPTHSGTATSGGVKIMNDTGAAFTSADIGRYVKFTAGTGSGQLPKKITAQTSTQLTVGEDWTVQPDATTVYEVYTPDLLVCRYLSVFDDRLVGLRIDGDPQTIGWSRSGIPNDWVGTGSGELILRSDVYPVDELMAYERISSNIAALFRRRSIMRSTPTGNTAQALGFFKWLENLGTESPFSVTVVPGGLMFLGNDRQVYFLSDTGLQPLSQSIQDELEATVGDLEVVEGEYDPSSQNFFLAVPDLSGSNTAVGWIFDFGRWRATGEVIWFRRTEVMNRMAIVESNNLIFAGADRIIREFNLAGFAGGYWISPMLNRADREAEFDLAKVILRYEASAATSIVIEGSGDGGFTWVAGRDTTVSLTPTTSELNRATQSFEVSGRDTRFRITFPTDAKVIVRSWQAELVQRSEFRSE